MSVPIVRVEGLRDLNRALKQLGGAAVDDLKETHKSAADMVAGATRPLIRVRTGALLSTVRTSGALRGGTVRVGTARRAPFHGKRFALLDIYEAVDTEGDRVVSEYERGMEELIRKYDLS